MSSVTETTTAESGLGQFGTNLLGTNATDDLNRALRTLGVTGPAKKTRKAETQGKPIKAILDLIAAGFTTIGLVDTAGHRYQLSFHPKPVIVGEGMGVYGVTIISGPDILMERVKVEFLTTVTLRQTPPASKGASAQAYVGASRNAHLDLEPWRSHEITKVYVERPAGEKGDKYLAFVAL